MRIKLVRYLGVSCAQYLRSKKSGCCVSHTNESVIQIRVCWDSGSSCGAYLSDKIYNPAKPLTDS